MFEIGKKYKNRYSHIIFECKAIDGDWAWLKNNEGYYSSWRKNEFHKFTEYKPPIVHKRYVHWYKVNNEVGTATLHEKVDKCGGVPVLHVEEVTFTEEQS